LSFLLHRTFTSGYLCTIALILFIHVGFWEYLSFKQFKLIVKMTRIESGVTIPKGLFTLYLNVKKVTAKIILAAIVRVALYRAFQSQSINKVPTRFDVYIKGNRNDIFATRGADIAILTGFGEHLFTKAHGFI
jgi:hypothetical protein